MVEGVTHSQTFLLLLSQCVFARWFCQREIGRALELGKRIILVRETDTRHGAARPLRAADTTVRCAHCKATARFAAPGASWPSACEEHADASMQPKAGVDASVSNDVLNFSLVHEELTADVSRLVLDPAGLELATKILVARTNVAAEVSWFAELEFRDVSLAKLLVALGMQAGRSSTWSEAVGLAQFAAGSARARREREQGGGGGGGGGRVLSIAQRTFSRARSARAARHSSGGETHHHSEGEEEGGEPGGDAAAPAGPEAPAASEPAPPAAARRVSVPASVAEADAVLRRTLQGLSCGVSAPPLRAPWQWHVCVIHGEESAATCRSIASALEVSFAGAKVFLQGLRGAEEQDPQQLAEAAAGARCALLFLTRDVLKPGTPQLAAAKAALAAGARFVLCHETDRARGGTPTFAEYLEDARASVPKGGAPPEEPNVVDIFRMATSIPWHHDLDFLPVCALKLLLEGVLEEESGDSPEAAQVTAEAAAAARARAAAQWRAAAAIAAPAPPAGPAAGDASFEFPTAGSPRPGSRQRGGGAFSRNPPGGHEELGQRLEALSQEREQLAARLAEREREAAAAKAEAELLKAQLEAARRQLARVRRPQQQAEGTAEDPAGGAQRLAEQQQQWEEELQKRLLGLRGSPAPPPTPPDALGAHTTIPIDTQPWGSSEAVSPSRRQKHLQHLEQFELAQAHLLHGGGGGAAVAAAAGGLERQKSLGAGGMAGGGADRPTTDDRKSLPAPARPLLTPPATGAGFGRSAPMTPPVQADPPVVNPYTLPPLRGVALVRNRGGGAGGGGLIPQSRRRFY